MPTYPFAESNLYDIDKFALGDLLTGPQRMLVDRLGTPVDLTGCTVSFRLVRRDTGVLALNAAAVVAQDSNDPSTVGRVRYDWQTGDPALVVAGVLYNAYFVVANAGRSEHFPADPNWLVEFFNG